jgi:hypothetical protein
MRTFATSPAPLLSFNSVTSIDFHALSMTSSKHHSCIPLLFHRLALRMSTIYFPMVRLHVDQHATGHETPEDLLAHDVT